MVFDVNPLIDRLCTVFPECFNRSDPKALKIGVGHELLALVGVHPALMEVSKVRLRRALKVYTNSPAYRRTLAAGGLRYDLHGQPAGEVTPEQQTLAPQPRRPKSHSTPQKLSPVSRSTPLIELTALLPELIAMAIPGKLDVTLKINQLPQAKPASPGTMLFAVQVEGRTVLVELKNKAWNSLKTATDNYPQWVAAISGKLGEAIEGGFRLENPSVQVFEKKAKPEAAAPPMPEPKAPEPPAAPAMGYVKMSLKGRT